jgi:hypothetical protein
MNAGRLRDRRPLKSRLRRDRQIAPDVTILPLDLRAEAEELGLSVVMLGAGLAG